jgi:hypothetical protein
MHVRRERSETPGVVTSTYVEYDTKRVYIAAISTMAYIAQMVP